MNIIRTPAIPAPSRVNVVLHWIDELRRIVPGQMTVVRTRAADGRMARTFVLVIAAALVSAVGSFGGQTQELRIGIIDFYGLRHVTVAQARAVLGFGEGDVLRPGAAEKNEAERRLAQLPGVLRARINVVCCDAGRAVVYVGIEETGAPALRFRAPPRGTVTLAADIVQAGDELSRAVRDAVRRGDAGEDDSAGHTLMHDPAARAVQQRFIGFAARDLRQLRTVVRGAADADQRALAAEVLGYAADKRAVVGDLTFALTDPSDSVRNNAMRALAVIAGFAAASPGLGIRVPFAPFVDLLNSPVWTDRNKATFALESLSKDRDASLLAALRERALPALIEMARWKSDGHAGAAFFLLGRLGGLSEDEITSYWDRRDREAVIRAASAASRRLRARGRRQSRAAHGRATRKPQGNPLKERCTTRTMAETFTPKCEYSSDGTKSLTNVELKGTRAT